MKLITRFSRLLLVSSLLFAFVVPAIPANALSVPYVSFPESTDDDVSQADADYRIQFNLDEQLTGNLSEVVSPDTITIYFPDDTIVDAAITASIAAGSGWIEFGDSSPQYLFAIITGTANFTGDPVNRTITFTLNSEDYIGQGAEVRIKITEGITNPSSPGDYVLAVKTSQEPAPISSSSYTIKTPGTPDPVVPGAVSQPIVTLPALDDFSINQTDADYVIRFKVNEQLTGNISQVSTPDTITFTFPVDTVIDPAITASITAGPGWIDLGEGFPEYQIALIHGTANFTGDSANSSITFTMNHNDYIGEDAEVRIEITEGITNPSSPGDYTLTVHTSQETMPVASTSYQIIDPDAPPDPEDPPDTEGVSQPLVLFPQLEDRYISKVNAHYKIQFDVNEQLTGNLSDVTNEDTITIAFPEDTLIHPDVTASIEAGEGWIHFGNGLPQYHPSIITGTANYTVNSENRTITFTMNNGDYIGEGAEVTIDITGGTVNPSSPGDYTLTVNTSQEPTLVESVPYNITVPDIPPLSGVVTVRNFAGIILHMFTGNDAISNAVNHAYTDCVIEVGDGTYVGYLEIITPGITIKGVGAEAIVTGDGTKPNAVIAVLAENTTISNLKIQENLGLGVGIYLNDVFGCVIEDNIISDMNAIGIVISSPADAVFPITTGGTIQYTAIGIITDGSTENLTSVANWTSSQPGVAYFDLEDGLIHILSEGSTNVSASFNGEIGLITGQTTLRVGPEVPDDLIIEPENASVESGDTQQYTATGVYSDNSTVDLTALASWSSTNTLIATIDSMGLASAVAAGSTTIHATYGVTSNTSSLTVTTTTYIPPSYVPPPTPTTSTVDTGNFTATPSLIIDSNGIVQSSTQLTSADNKVTFSIEAGTELLDSEGNPLTTLSYDVIENPPAPPEETSILVAFDFGPDGATFDPAITLVVPYDPADLPEGTDDNSLVITWWNGSEWVNLETTVDPETNTLTVNISHFTNFAVMMPVVPVEVETVVEEQPPVIEEESSVEEEPVVEEELAEEQAAIDEQPATDEESDIPEVGSLVPLDEKTSDGGISWWAWWILGIAVGLVVVVGYYYWWKPRREPF